MFDYIEYEAKCKKCDAELSGFQSKDKKCELESLKPKDVDYFYTICDKCRSFNEFYVERECTVKNITQSIEVE